MSGQTGFRVIPADPNLPAPVGNPVVIALVLILAGCAGHEPADARERAGGSAAPRGTLENPIVDSRVTWESERKKALARGFPQAIVDRQTLVDLQYWSFDGKVHQGQLVIDARLAEDIRTVFRTLLEERFPIRSVIPISRFGWDDTESMNHDNTSGFNYRKIKGKDEWSNHAFGQAVDINTFENPYLSGRHVSPKGARYNPAAPGTFVRGTPIVALFRRLGWGWGGDWKNMKDYQHFEKVLR